MFDSSSEASREAHDVKPWMVLYSVLFIAVFSLFYSVPVTSQTGAELPGFSSSQYKLDSGDQIRIQVYNEQDLFRETRVDDRGMISYPFLGDVNVSGMTPDTLEKHITSHLAGKYLINPKVSVEIVEHRPFYVDGEVQSPGGFPFQPGITVRKAISIAGGFRERADTDGIYVIRDDAPDNKPLRLDLDDRVMPGDIITVEQSFF